MKYDILKDFAGSQDGRFTENFKAGTQAELSDYLAGIVVPDGWARPVKIAAADGEYQSAAGMKAEAKPEKPKAKKRP